MVENKEFVLSIRELGAEEKHAHREIEIDYLLRGSAELVLSGDVFSMQKGDIILINAHKFHWWQHMRQGVVCRVLISEQLIGRTLGRQNLRFWCNSVANSAQDVDSLRVILNDLIRSYRAAGPYGSFSLESAKYRLLESLTEHFRLEADELEQDGEDERVRQVLEYINLHYSEGLSLAQIAGRLYLSESYLSRLFKTAVGMNFREYLSRVRLNNAVESLLYTGKSITVISQECGFETPSAFNKLFQRNYHCSPSEYKRRFKKEEPETIPTDPHSNALVDGWLKEEADGKQPVTEKMQVVEIAARSGRPLQRNTIGWLNFGTAADLLQAVLQEQLLRLHQALGVQYVRLGEIFSRELYVRKGAGTDRYTFALMDTVLDFLIENGMIPVLDMTVRGKRAWADIGEDLFREDKDPVPFRDLADWCGLLENFLNHLAERYGGERLETWFFELDESEAYQELCAVQGRPGIPYVALWKSTRLVLDRVCQGARLGGSISLIQDPAMIPDFVTHTLYPYARYGCGKDVYSQRITDLHFVEAEVKRLRHRLERAGRAELPLVITAWNTSISERNAYNDSCGKAAHVLLHLTALEGENCILCYQHGSDFLSQYLDTTKPFVGGNGLLTKDGICKPVFYAFLFMNSLRGDVVSKGENFLVTCHRGSEYNILLFQPEKFSHIYFLNKESQIRADMLPEIYEERVARPVNFQILNRGTGRYRLKTWYMTEEEGSALREWQRMGSPEQLGAEEVQYLRALCRPRMEKSEGKIQNGRVRFDGMLGPNQITLIQIRIND